MEYLDMLAKLGIGNAHPGGFAATLNQFKQYPLPKNSRILEVGCGTGRTSCYAASQGHEVTGLDIRPEMIAKAKLRAEKEQVPVQFLQGDAASLPFPDGSFDVVLVESVSIFVDTPKALSEYARVLRPGGKVYDREMVLRKSVSPEIHEELGRFFQVKKLWDTREWTDLLQLIPLQHTQVEGPYEFPSISEDMTEHPDHFQEIDSGSYLNPKIWNVIQRYNEIMGQYREDIGYILIIGTK